MALTTGQVAMTSGSGTLIVAAENANTIYIGQGTQRRVVLLNLDATNDIYIGPTSAVTTATGLKLVHGVTTPTTLTIGEGDAIYGISNASTPTVAYAVAP